MGLIVCLSLRYFDPQGGLTTNNDRLNYFRALSSSSHFRFSIFERHFPTEFDCSFTPLTPPTMHRFPLTKDDEEAAGNFIDSISNQSVKAHDGPIGSNSSLSLQSLQLSLSSGADSIDIGYDMILASNRVNEQLQRLRIESEDDNVKSCPPLDKGAQDWLEKMFQEFGDMSSTSFEDSSSEFMPSARDSIIVTKKRIFRETLENEKQARDCEEESFRRRPSLPKL